MTLAQCKRLGIAHSGLQELTETRSVEFERLDDHPDFWTLVDVAERETAGLSDSEDSVVVVSRCTGGVAPTTRYAWLTEICSDEPRGY